VVSVHTTQHEAIQLVIHMPQDAPGHNNEIILNEFVEQLRQQSKWESSGIGVLAKCLESVIRC